MWSVKIHPMGFSHQQFNKGKRKDNTDTFSCAMQNVAVDVLPQHFIRKSPVTLELLQKSDFQ